MFKCKRCGSKFEAFDTAGGIIAGLNLPCCPKCGSCATKKSVLVNPFFRSLTGVIICLLIVSCNSDNPLKEELSPETAMEKFIQLTPSEGAKFYKEKRDIFSFLDQLYGDSIIPVLQYCDYYELKNVCSYLDSTPHYKDAYELLTLSKDAYIQRITEDVAQCCEYEKNVFKESILPAIELEIDSLLEKDIEETMSKYAGGLLNYKKLSFLFGRGRNDFKQMFWDVFDLEKYQKRIAAHIQSYLDSISCIQERYCISTTGKSYKAYLTIEYPELRIGLSKSTLKHIQDYTSKQTDEMITDIVKDWIVPAALASMTGGLGTLYDIGTFAYDIKVTLDDIKVDTIDPDDMVGYVCCHDLSYQIDNYYLNKCIERVNTIIEVSNKKLLNQIIQSL